MLAVGPPRRGPQFPLAREPLLEILPGGQLAIGLDADAEISLLGFERRLGLLHGGETAGAVSLAVDPLIEEPTSVPLVAKLGAPTIERLLVLALACAALVETHDHTSRRRSARPGPGSAPMRPRCMPLRKLYGSPAARRIQVFTVLAGRLSPSANQGRISSAIASCSPDVRPSAVSRRYVSA